MTQSPFAPVSAVDHVSVETEGDTKEILRGVAHEHCFACNALVV